MTDGERVKAVRKAKGLTLEKFGKQFGMSKSAISDIENGRRALTTQTRLSICREYNVNETWLRTGEGEMFEPESGDALDSFIRERRLSQTDRVIIEKFAALDATSRQAVVDYMLSVVEELSALTPEPDAKESEYAQWEREADELAADVREQYLQEKIAEAESSVLPSDTGNASGGKMA